MPQIDTLMNGKMAMIALAILAFLVAAVLVLVIVKMLFGGRLRIPGGRPRQARLGVVDAFEFGQKRQLIIVRRDNTEHLIMIGGPNDLLIESEIVRVEAREARDGRRDKQDMYPSTSDARIPAPLTPAVDRPEPTLPDQPRAPSFEPGFTLPLPLGPSPLPTLNGPLTTEAAEAAPRSSTFPLPPRRPLPAPPRLPESVSRADDAPSTNTPAVVETPAPAPAPVGDIAPMPEPSVTPPTPPARPAPPFLKPLPPRPPLRPLQRTTPQAPSPPQPAAGGTLDNAPPVGTPAPKMPAATMPPLKPRPSISPTMPKPAPKIAQAPPPPSPEPPDALESLEEEMAKLLGRGPG